MSEEKTLTKAELRQQRLDKLEQNEKMKKLIFSAVVAILIVIFIGGIVLGLKRVLSTEGTMENPNDKVYSATVETAEMGIEKLKAITDFAYDPENASRVRLKVSTSLSVDEGSIQDTAGDERFSAVMKYMKNDIVSAVSGKYEKYEESFSSDYTNQLLPNDFKASDLKSFEYIGTATDEERKLSFTFNDAEYPQKEGSLLYRNFDMEDSGLVAQAAREAVSSVVTVDAAELKCKGFNITATYSAENDLVKSISYNRSYELRLKLTFVGELSEIGKKELTLNLSACENHSFTYAELRLDAHRMWLEKGDIDNLEAVRTYDEAMLDDSGIEAARVLWTVSDPEVATVDAEGYVKGRRVSQKPVTVTATYTFLGNTYKDSCLVYVREPLEEIRVSEKEAELNIGETKTVSVSCKPEKATFKQVDWFSSDEAVATVDQYGVVTASAVGEADIFAISLDGNFKSTCKLTVKEGENNG